MEAKRTAQPESQQPCHVSDIQDHTPGSASNGPSEASTFSSPGKRGRNRLWAGASLELGKKRARGATADPGPARSEAHEKMYLKYLRELADRTPGHAFAKEGWGKVGE